MVRYVLKFRMKCPAPNRYELENSGDWQSGKKNPTHTNLVEKICPRAWSRHKIWTHISLTTLSEFIHDLTYYFVMVSLFLVQWFIPPLFNGGEKYGTRKSAHSKIIIVMRNRWFWFVTWKIQMNNFNNRTQLAPTFITGIGWKRVEIIKCKQKIMFNWTPKFTNKLLDIEKNPLCFHMGMRGL